MNEWMDGLEYSVMLDMVNAETGKSFSYFKIKAKRI